MKYIFISDLIQFVVSLNVFIYGFKHFFKKGKALYLQIITFVFASNAIACLCNICQIVTIKEIYNGFNISYLSQMSCFLALLTANFGQIDGILDDGSNSMRKSRIIALLAPFTCLLILVPNLYQEKTLIFKISYIVMWIPAILSSYYNLKHFLIPDMGFGFVKAIRPYNLMAVIYTFLKLIYLTIMGINPSVILIILSTLIAIVDIILIVSVKKGVEKWTI